MDNEEISLDEANAFIAEWPYQDDFVCHYWRLVGFEGDDNSLDLAHYWQQRMNIVENNKQQQINP